MSLHVFELPDYVQGSFHFPFRVMDGETALASFHTKADAELFKGAKECLEAVETWQVDPWVDGFPVMLGTLPVTNAILGIEDADE